MPAPRTREDLPFVARKIRDLRLQAGLSNYMLGKKAGVGGRLLYKLENGTIASLLFKNLQKVAWALGVSLAEFDEPKPPENAA